MWYYCAPQLCQIIILLSRCYRWTGACWFQFSLRFLLVVSGLVFLCDIFAFLFAIASFIDRYQCTCLERFVSQMTWCMLSETLNYSVTHFTMYITNWLYHSLALWVSWWIVVFVCVLIVLSVKKTQNTSSLRLSLVKTVCQGMAEIWLGHWLITQLRCICPITLVL